MAVGRNLDVGVDLHHDRHVGRVRRDGGHRPDGDPEDVHVVADVDAGSLGEVRRHGVGRRGQRRPYAEEGDHGGDDAGRRRRSPPGSSGPR